jgi:hypothetical protein
MIDLPDAAYAEAFAVEVSNSFSSYGYLLSRSGCHPEGGSVVCDVCVEPTVVYSTRRCNVIPL